MVKVYNAETDPKLFLKLIQDGSRASLILVDKHGSKHHAGNVCSISENGISFHSSVTDLAPFKLNSNGEIFNVDKDDE